jgi:hypothetical protein
VRGRYVEEVEAGAVEGEAVDDVLDLVDWPVGEGGLVVPELGDAGPDLLVGRAEDAEDAVELVELAVAGEQRPLGHHFGEDAADGPDVDGRAVVHGAEQDFGGAVPERDDFLGVGADGDGVGPGEAEVRDLEVVCVGRGVPLVSRRMLAGLRSRWMMRFMWQSAMPASIWYRNFLTFSASICRLPSASMYARRSLSRYSKIR